MFEICCITDADLHKLAGSPEEKALYTSEFRAALAPLDKANVISLCLELSDR